MLTETAYYDVEVTIPQILQVILTTAVLFPTLRVDPSSENDSTPEI